MGLATTIACSIVKEFKNFQSFQSIVIIWLSLSAVTDVAIAVTMVIYLRGHRTGMAQSEDIVTRLIRCELFSDSGVRQHFLTLLLDTVQT